jgi:hypothetical protein
VTVSWDGAHTYTIKDSAEKFYTSGFFAILQCSGSGTNTLTVNSNPVEYTTIGPKGIIITAYTPGVTRMDFDLGDQSNQFTLESNGVPISIDNTKGGTDALVLGSAGASGSSTMANIQGNVSVANPSGSSTLALYDGADVNQHYVSMYDGSITGLAPATISWTPTSTATGGVTSLAVYGGSGYENNYDVYNTSNLYKDTVLNTGSGTFDYVFVAATTGGLYINNNGGSLAYVDVGVQAPFTSLNTATTANINGFVDAYATGSGAISLTLLDDGDTTSRTVSMYSNEVVGLAPANIYWSPVPGQSGGVDSLEVDSGSGTNTFNVYNTSGFQSWWTDLVSTSGSNMANSINVYATTGGLNILPNGYNVIDVGVGNMANINGWVNVEQGNNGEATLALNDSSDTNGRTVTMHDGVNNPIYGTGGEVTGMAPANIYWSPSSSYNGGVTSLDVEGGSGGNTFNVRGTSHLVYWTSIFTGSGNDTVNVYATTGGLDVINSGGADNINIGLGSLANINGWVNVYGTGSTGLYLNDGNDTTGRTVSMYDGEITGLAPANITWTPSASASGGVTYLALIGGAGGDTFNVYNTSSLYFYTYLDTSIVSSPDTVNVYATTGGLDVYNPGGSVTTDIGVGSLANINGWVDVYGAGSTNLILDDTLDTSSRTVSMYDGELTGMAPANVYWTGTSSATGGVVEIHVWGGLVLLR